MTDLLKYTLGSSAWKAIARSFQWEPCSLWLYFTSGGFIVLSYFCIPADFIYLVYERRELPFNWVIFLSAEFIVVCGTTHLIQIWRLSIPLYKMHFGIDALTAVPSILTALSLWPLQLRAIAITTSVRLETAKRNLKARTVERHRAEKVLRITVDELPQLKHRTNRSERHKIELKREINHRTQELSSRSPITCRLSYPTRQGVRVDASFG